MSGLVVAQCICLHFYYEENKRKRKRGREEEKKRKEKMLVNEDGVRREKRKERGGRTYSVPTRYPVFSKTTSAGIYDEKCK